jgi:hypothetical protein
MPENKVGCLRSTLIGCGLSVLAAIAVPVILAVMVVLPLNRAVKDRQIIEQRFGAQADYVPPPSGIPEPARIEAFLQIQGALVDVCADLEEAESSVAAMEALDDQDEINRLEVMRMAMRTTRNMMGMGPVIGTLYEVRNRELLDREMGLGEYTYIFATAYNEQLTDPESEFQLFGPGAVNSRIREALRSMLRSQYEAVQAAGGDDERLAPLAAEMEALGADDSRLLWQDGLPDNLAAAYAPYRPRLDELYCAAAAPLQLMINEKRGLAIESK